MSLADNRVPAIEEVIENVLRAEFGDALERSAELKIERIQDGPHDHVAFTVKPRRETAAPLFVECEPSGSEAVLVVGEAAQLTLVFGAREAEWKKFTDALRGVCQAVRVGGIREVTTTRRGRIVKSVAEVTVGGENLVLRTSRLSNPLIRGIKSTRRYDSYD